MTMIMGHAPLVFPAVLGIAIPFRGRFYLHLGILEGTLAVRVQRGDGPARPARITVVPGETTLVTLE